jgi:hypothetical protein
MHVYELATAQPPLLSLPAHPSIRPSILDNGLEHDFKTQSRSNVKNETLVMLGDAR